MNRTATLLGLSLAALALVSCAGPEKAAPATPAAPAKAATPATPATPVAPAVAKTPAAPHATGRPELRYYEIAAA